MGLRKREKQLLNILTIYEQGVADVTRNQDVVFQDNLAWLQKNKEHKSEKTGDLRNKSTRSKPPFFLAFPS